MVLYTAKKEWAVADADRERMEGGDDLCGELSAGDQDCRCVTAQLSGTESLFLRDILQAGESLEA